MYITIDKQKRGYLKAFSLTELLIVMVIIGILVLVALPNLMPLISRARSTEAKLQLNHAYTLQKTHFMEYSTYSDKLEQIGFEQEELVEDGGQANYTVEIIESSSDGFIIQAKAIVDFDKDGIYNVWQIDQDKNLKEITKD